VQGSITAGDALQDFARNVFPGLVLVGFPGKVVARSFQSDFHIRHGPFIEIVGNHFDHLRSLVPETLIR
jgi:hypothetical protein